MITHSPSRSILLRRSLSTGTIAAAVMACGGCQSMSASDSAPQQAANPPLRRLEIPKDATPIDADRAALSRFVGVWDFSGWATAPDGSHTPGSGRAAAAIENQHFLLIDVQAASGQTAGRAGHKGGSMLFASEPRMGLTLTAWGDASPSLTRLTGHCEGSCSKFVFNEVNSPSDSRTLALTISFQSDDRWVADVRDNAASGHPVVASYVFTRVP